MGVRILQSDDRDSLVTMAVMYCSTTDWAFGPVFFGDGVHEADERAELFNSWLPKDARTYTDAQLSEKYKEWLSKEEELWAAKEKEQTDEN